jgi:hypothetical protein
MGGPSGEICNWGCDGGYADIESRANPTGHNPQGNKNKTNKQKSTQNNLLPGWDLGVPAAVGSGSMRTDFCFKHQPGHQFSYHFVTILVFLPAELFDAFCCLEGVLLLLREN